MIQQGFAATIPAPMIATIVTRIVTTIATLMLAGCAMTGARDHPALWHAANGSGNQLWIFGSIHRLPTELYPRFIDTRARSLGRSGRRNPSVSSRIRGSMPTTSWFHGPLQHAFRRTPDLMIETTDELSMQELAALALADEPADHCRPIAEYIRPESRRRLKKLLDFSATAAGVESGKSRASETPAELKSATGALFTVTTLDSARVATRGEAGVDRLLTAQARRSGKDVIALETAGDRLETIRRTFAEASCETQAQLVDEYIMFLTESDASDKREADFEDSVTRWRNGDIEALERALQRFHDESELLFQALIAQRNRLWLPRIVEQVEKSHSTLLVVGSAHLAGPDNLLQLLERQGFEIQRVQ